MTDRTELSDEETRRLVVTITGFLRDQLTIRNDLLPGDRDYLEIAIQSLEMAYNLDTNGYIQYGSSRPLMDIFNQVTNPVSVKDKIRADAHKEEGNNYIRSKMFANAETEYTEAIKMDRWNAIYYCNRASSRIEQRNFFDAIADCRQALMLNPDYAKAYSRMGQAYTLLHRPREAARCFRQALELEPENEKFRHNLTVAENQINRPDAAEVITDLLSSLFRLRPRVSENRSSRLLPPIFMIITESHPPTVASSQTGGRAQGNESSQSTPMAKNDRRGIGDSINSSNQYTFLRPYGVIDERAVEKPIFEFNLPSENKNHDNSENAEESVVHIPLDALNFEFIPTMQPVSSEADSNLRNTKIVDKRPTEKIKDNLPGGQPQPQGESQVKSNGEHSAHLPLRQFNHMKSDPNILENNNKLCSSIEHKDNHSGKDATEACINEAKQKATGKDKIEANKEETALSTVKHSSNIALETHQNRKSEIPNGSSMDNKRTACSEKPSCNSKPGFINDNDDEKKNQHDAIASEKQKVVNNENAGATQDGVSDKSELSDKSFSEDMN